MDRSVCVCAKLLGPVDTMEGTQGASKPFGKELITDVPARQQRSGPWPDAMASAPAYGPHLLLLLSQITPPRQRLVPPLVWFAGYTRAEARPCVAAVTLELLPENVIKHVLTWHGQNNIPVEALFAC